MTLKIDLERPESAPLSDPARFPGARHHVEQRHALVIGAGFGGLAAAIRLGVRGYRVTVLEKLDAPGGRAYVFRQNGFTCSTLAPRS